MKSQPKPLACGKLVIVGVNVRAGCFRPAGHPGPCSTVMSGRY